MNEPMRTYGEKWHGFRAAPRPPREIELEMEAAGKSGDAVVLGLARAKYQAWLEDNGHAQPTLHGHPPRADEAAR